ncbi:MAG TPA: F0F1 ATP synthase subunit alpha [Candidatus Saccharimonadales bacterium]|nr:F0F1 ATP synthase subunit alpha [Candidatus Saccharimonadales bacterium]
MTKLSLAEITAELQTAITNLPATAELKGRGVVSRLGDGAVTIHGLPEAQLGEVLELKTGSETANALVLNLLEDEIGAVLLDENEAIGAGAEVTRTGRQLSVPVGDGLLGRVIDPLGRPLDGLGAIKAKTTHPIESPAPDVMSRKSVHEPVATGILAIDGMTPIGRGQRQLIIGDRQTGKTAIALDTMLNQVRQQTGIISIYIAIGQKRSTIAQLVERLRQDDALAQSIIVATSPTDPATLQYLAPYAGAAIGEHIRDNGGHALAIYDDLTRHAQAYRQMSLLLRRPPGREAYPGDVFYLHSRLLERAAKLNDALGAGSLTALPIIETQAGNISAYIPTNVISITDGQIFLTSDLFNQGIRPAIDVGNSVSRVGGAAMPKVIKKLGSPLRVSLAQYAEVAAFTQFASDLDEDTRAQLERGQRLTELLKQPQFQPLSVAEQAILLLAGTTGPLDAVPTAEVLEARHSLIKELGKHDKLVKALNGGDEFSDSLQEAMKKVITIGLQDFVTSKEPA